jgi:flagellar basal body-associated protein FliL
MIRNELITGFNNILGDSVVQEIYLTEFAIQ